MQPLNTVLVIDDEPQIRRLLQITLEANNYTVYEAADGKQALQMAAQWQPMLIILDLQLPDTDGKVVLQKLREFTQQPVIILSARTQEEEIIQALDSGANDYLTKPFRTGELLARVRLAMRQSTPQLIVQQLTFGNLTIDLQAHTVRKSNEIVKLTTTEYALLVLLAQNAGRVLTHQFILKQIWGLHYTDQTQYLRVFVAQLRKKIEDNPAKPIYLNTESGIGYRFGQ